MLLLLLDKTSLCNPFYCTEKKKDTALNLVATGIIAAIAVIVAAAAAAANALPSPEEEGLDEPPEYPGSGEGPQKGRHPGPA